nr:hypothetical protein [Tanacetum cinerariifolium]
QAPGIACGLDFTSFQVVVVAVYFRDVGSAGQDGLPVLGVGDAQLIEDASSVVKVTLLDAGQRLSSGHQVEGDGFGKGLRFDCENNVFVSSNPLFELVANVQF